jgi:trans-aconitate methyltransferase
MNNGKRVGQRENVSSTSFGGCGRGRVTRLVIQENPGHSIVGMDSEDLYPLTSQLCVAIKA